MANSKTHKNHQIKHPKDVKVLAQELDIRPMNITKDDEETIFTAEDESSGSLIEVKLAQYKILDPGYYELSSLNLLWVYVNNKWAHYFSLANDSNNKNPDEVLGSRNKAYLIGDMLKQLGPRTNKTEISDLIKYYRTRMPELMANEDGPKYPNRDEEHWISDYVPSDKKHLIPQLLEGFHIYKSPAEEARELERWG